MSNRELLDGVEAVFFDLFDTLIWIDTDQLPRMSYRGRQVPTTLPWVHQNVLAPRGVDFDTAMESVGRVWREISAEKQKSWIEVSALDRSQRVIQDLGIASDADDLAELAHATAETHARGLADAARPIEGARRVLEAAAESFQVALISNFDYAPAVEWILERTELIDLLEKRVVSETLGVRKPHERMFQDALEHFEVTPEASLHIGDQPKPDAWGAGRLGLRTVWINAARNPYPEDEHPPTLVVERLDQLLRHFDDADSSTE